MPTGNDSGDAGWNDYAFQYGYQDQLGQENGASLAPDASFGALGFDGDENNWNGSNGLNDQFLKNLGWTGGRPYNNVDFGPQGTDGGGGRMGPGGVPINDSGYTPEWQQFVADKGLTFRANSPEGTFKSLLQAYNPSGKQVGTQLIARRDPDNEFAATLAVLGAAFGGFAGAGMAAGAGYGAGTAVGGAAAGAGAGLGGGLASSADISTGLKGAATGALTGGLTGGLDVAGYAGVTDPTYANMLNKGVSGGINSAAKGGNPITGAAMGAGGAGANAMWGEFLKSMGGGGENFSQGFSGGFDGSGDSSGGYSAAPSSGNNFASMGLSGQQTPWQVGGDFSPAPFQPTLFQTMGLADMPNGTRMQPMSGGDPSDAHFSDMPQLGNMGGGAAVLPSGNLSGDPAWMDYLRKNGGGLAQGLAGLYMGNRQANMMGKARGQLDQMYAPNSPFAQQMRQRIQRSDAAAGRRTQVGNRETQLAAALTDARTRMLTSPQYMGLMQGQQGGMQQGIGTLLNLFGNKNTRDMFTGAPAALQSGYDSLSQYFGG